MSAENADISQADYLLQTAVNNTYNGNFNNIIDFLYSAAALAKPYKNSQAQAIYSLATVALQELGYNPSTGTSSVIDQLNQILDLLKQEQNKNVYTESDLQTVQNAINQLENISNNLNNGNAVVSTLGWYVGTSLVGNAKQLQTKIQDYLEQQKLMPQLENALATGNLNEALNILNQLKSYTTNTSEVEQAINTINQVQSLLDQFNTAMIQGQNPQFIVNQLSALASNNNQYLTGLSNLINNLTTAFSPNNSSQEVQIQYNQTVANDLMNNDYAGAIAAAPQYAPYINALAQTPGSTFNNKVNSLISLLYNNAMAAYQALKAKDTNAAQQYKVAAKQYLNLLNAIGTMTGQNFSENSAYNDAVNALNAVINVIGDAAVAVTPSVLSSGNTPQRAQPQLL